MSYRHTPAGLNGDASLRAALSSLPLAAPARSAWPALETVLRVQAVPRRPRWLPAALVAGLALAALSPRFISTPSSIEVTTVAGSTSVPTTNATNTGDELAALHARSQQLETWLQRLADHGASLTGQDLMAAAEIEDLIGLVDLQLAAADKRPEAAGLWRQRISLLEDLAAIRAQPYAVDATGVAVNAVVPSTWIN